MPNQNVAAQNMPGCYPVLPVVANSLDLVFTAKAGADPFSTELVDRKTVILVSNTDAVLAHTVSFEAVPDSLNRDGDVSGYSLGAGELAILGPFRLAGWNSGTLTAPLLVFDVDNVAVRVAVIEIP